MDTLNGKPRLATVWLGGCSGCHMSLLDLDEGLLELAARVDVVYSPLVDAKEFPAADLTLVEGAVVNEENLEQIRTIRSRTRVLAVFGDCGLTGNVPALRNPFPLEEVLGRAYRETAVPALGVPGLDGTLPRLLDRVRPVHEVVPVDHFLPGCPPAPADIKALVLSVLDGTEAPREGKRFG